MMKVVHIIGKNMASYNKCLPCYTENELLTTKTEKGGVNMEPEKKKFDWLGLIIKIVGAAIAFLTGTQVNI